MKIIVDLLLSPEPGDKYLSYSIAVHLKVSDIDLVFDDNDLTHGVFFITGRIKRLDNPYGVRIVKITKNLFKKVLFNDQRIGTSWSVDLYGETESDIIDGLGQRNSGWIRTEIEVDNYIFEKLLGYNFNIVNTYE